MSEMTASTFRQTAIARAYARVGCCLPFCEYAADTGCPKIGRELPADPGLMEEGCPVLEKHEAALRRAPGPMYYAVRASLSRLSAGTEAIPEDSRSETLTQRPAETPETFRDFLRGVRDNA